MLSISLYGSVYPSFTNNEILHIEKKFGKEAYTRIYEYGEKIKTLKSDSEFIKLTKINIFLNHKLKYKSDKTLNNKSDYWATPKEFLTIGSGDCEDYAIIKYFSLLKLGFKKDKLFITLVYDTFTKSSHMVLSYFESNNKAPLILDSLSYEILNLDQRADLKVNAFINTNGVYKLTRTKKLKKTKLVSNKFKELLKRIDKES